MNQEENSSSIAFFAIIAILLSANFILVEPAFSQTESTLKGVSLQDGTNGLNNNDDSLPSLEPSSDIIDKNGNSSSQLENTETFGGDSIQADYILGPGDRLETRILGYETFDWSLTDRFVLSDGTIRFPFVGTVVVEGKTLDVLEAELTRQLASYLRFPVLDIGLTTLRPVVVSVTGDVYRPGPIQLRSLTEAESNVARGGGVASATTTPNLAAALVAAGGIQRTADIRNVRITRRLSNGRRETFTVNLWEFIQDDLNGSNIPVMFDGDTIYVPEANFVSNLDQTLVSSSTIAPALVRVRVIGEVVEPGEVEIQPNSSVSSAIAAAGGPDTLTAQLDSARLIRLSQSGHLEEETVDLTSLTDDYQIQDGDVIFIPKKGYLSAVDSVSRVLTPLFAPLNIFNLFNLFD